MKHFLVYEKVNIILLEVTSKPFSEERRLSGRGSNILFKVSVVAINKGTKNSEKKKCNMDNIATLKEILKRQSRFN